MHRVSVLVQLVRTPRLLGSPCVSFLVTYFSSPRVTADSGYWRYDMLGIDGSCVKSDEHVEAKSGRSENQPFWLQAGTVKSGLLWQTQFASHTNHWDVFRRHIQSVCIEALQNSNGLGVGSNASR